MEFTTVIGWLGLVLSVGCGFPQLYRIWCRKSAADISIATYIMLWVAVTCYGIHAVAENQLVFVVSNSFNFVVSGTIVVSIIYHRFVKRED